jgi:hypothetical protein
MRSIATALIFSWVCASHAGCGRDWELENVVRHSKGDLNVAELGMANMIDAMRDPSMLSEFAEELRDEETRAELVKMMADPKFQEQAKEAFEQLKASGFPTEILSLEYYAETSEEETVPSQSLATLLLAVNPAGTSNRYATRNADVSMMAAKRLFQPKGKAAAKKVAPKKVAPKRVAPKRAAPKKVAPKKVAPKRAAPPPRRAAAPAPAPVASTGAALEELIALAESTPGPVQYWDPLCLSTQNFWGVGNDATVQWLRHAEIKHGRVAMAGFVGYCIHENGIRWPFPLTTSLPDYSSFEGLSAPDVWDATPQAARLQIIVVIGFFEFWSEWTTSLEKDGMKHYMAGGQPGQFPAFNTILPNPFWPLPLFDPFGFTKGLSEEEKAVKRVREIQNGRLAMLGLFSLIAEAKVPGAVPALAGLIKPYSGQVMAPFNVADANLPGVSTMIEGISSNPVLRVLYNDGPK